MKWSKSNGSVMRAVSQTTVCHRLATSERAGCDGTITLDTLDAHERRPDRPPQLPGGARHDLDPDRPQPPTARTRPPSATSTPGAAARRGRRAMRDLLGGKGAGLAEMTKRRPADPARLHDHDRGLQRLLRRRRAAPGRPVGRRPRGGQAGRARDRQGLRRPGQPAARQRPLGRQVLDARHDGHGPQPRPQRGRRSQGLIALTGNERFGWDAYRRFIQMFGRIVMDVSGERFDHALDAAKARARRQAGHRPRRRRPARARRPSSRRSSRPTPAATSPTTRTSSSTWPSRPSSRRGSASAPATTARTRTSPTTWARPSTS